MRNVIYQLILFLYTNNQDDVYALAARNILKNIDKIQDCSITDLADLCYVSPATISRLCRKLSFDSFSDFKSAIQSSAGSNYKDRYYPFYNDDLESHKSKEEILQNHFESIESTLRSTYENIDINDISKICQLIHDSNNIIFVGFHTAQFASIQFQEKLTFLGKDCYGSLNFNEQLNLIKNAKENDLIILASLTGGFSKSHPNLMRYFKRSPAHKVVFSNNPEFNATVDVAIDTLGTQDSLISKFNLTYVYELLEMEYTNTYRK